SPSLLGDPHDTLTLSTLSFHYARHHPDLHSFPTRRSSDLRRGLSAGRVQSVAVRLIFEREKEIEAFKPEEYWSIEARLEGDAPRSEEHTSELQSRFDLVCRLLLEKKNREP